jgi:hypothetical protein
MDSQPPVVHHYVHVFHHWPAEPVHFVLDTPARSAVRAGIHITTKEAPVPAALTVDDVNKKVRVVFYDDKNDVTNAPAGATASIIAKANDDGSGGATTLTPDPNDAVGADITPGPDGDSGSFVAALSNAFEPDGRTPIPDPDPLPYTVGPGGAVSAQLSVS